MKIFITGGTGLLGKDIVFELSKNHKLFILIRDDEKKEIFKSFKNINFVKGSMDKEESFKEKLAECDIVIHAAGTVNPKHSMNVNYGLTKKIISLCANNQKFVYISSFNATFKNKSNYTVSKQMAEKAVIESSLDYLIFRPTLLYNKKGDVYILKLIKQIIKLPFALQPGNGMYFLQPLFTEDFAQIISLSLNNINNRIISVAGKEAVSIKELIQLILSRTKTKPVLRIPVLLLRFMGRFVGLNRDKINELSENKTMNIDATEKEFNISLRSVREMLPEIIKYAKTT